MPTHEDYLHQALIVATQGKGHCAPNPAVGAVIVNKAGHIVASGYHHGVGMPHAEINALQRLCPSETDLTMYVTLEPCCHWGKTPPCTLALLKSPIKKIIYAYTDPNPLVAGKGAQQLMENGIICEYISLPKVNEFYASYLHWRQHQSPYVTAKIALSMDGFIALKSGRPIQITGNALQEITHAHRMMTDAILTTIATIQNDDPHLNARYQRNVAPKSLYLLDSRLQFSETAQVNQTAKSITIFHAREVQIEVRQNLEKQGIRCIEVEENATGLSLQQVMQQIGQDGIHDLWIEAGGKCLSSLMDQRLIHRLLIYLAPKWLKEGIPAFPNGFSLAELNPKQVGYTRFADDIMLDIGI